MPATLGERIAARRQQLGWSQIQLAHAAGLTPSAISLFESEKRKPSFEALKKLSDALGISADYFTEDRQGAAAETSDPRLKSVVDGFSLLDAAGREQLLESTLALLVQRAGGTLGVSTSEEPREAARQLVDRLGMQYPPVDPLLVACLLGLTVRMAPLSELDCEAMLDRRVDPPLLLVGRPEVGEGKSLNVHRLRFTIAHLLAHHVLPHHRAQAYRCREVWAGTRDDSAEKEAHQFAAELLMPGNMVERHLTTPSPNRPGPMGEALAMAGRFNTSVPSTVLQFARYHPHPCVALLTEGERVRETVASPSFPGILRDDLPAAALCLSTRGQKGVQERQCLDGEWLTDPQGAVLCEQAFHYGLSTDQSVTLLTVSAHR